MTWKVEPADLIVALNKVCGDWRPKPHQRPVFDDVFCKDLSMIQVEWARGLGKTVTSLKIAFTACELFPGRSVLYVAPSEKDGKDIVNEKYTSEFPHHLMGKSRASDGLFRFKNGSFLRIMGSDEDVGRGREPVLIVFEEFAYHGKRAQLALAPSLRKGGKLLSISTPPHIDSIESGKASHYDSMIDICTNPENAAWASFHRVDCEQAIAAGLYTRAFLAQQEAFYRGNGEYEEFLKEYYLQRVYKSKDNYFYDIEPDLLVPSTHMVKMVEGVGDPTWLMFGDTSGSTRYGVLFACLDEEKGILYLVDSIVRQRTGKNTTENRESSEMTPSKFWPLTQYKINKWTPGRNESYWDIRWDHDTTFMDVIPLMFGDHIQIVPVDKKYDKKKEIFSFIRDLIKTGRLYISEDVKDIIKEMKLLSVDPKTGEFSKKTDELLDCLRYMIMSYDACFEKRKALPTENFKDYWSQRIEDRAESLYSKNDEVELENFLRAGFWR